MNYGVVKGTPDDIALELNSRAALGADISFFGLIMTSFYVMESNGLLLEDGDELLQEDGFKIYLE